MSLSTTAAMAKAYGMSYGEYCMRVEMGTLPEKPKHEVEPSAPEVKKTISGAIRWTPEMAEYIMSMYRNGMKPEEISRRTNIPVSKIRNKIKYVKKNER